MLSAQLLAGTIQRQPEQLACQKATQSLQGELPIRQLDCCYGQQRNGKRQAMGIQQPRRTPGPDGQSTGKPAGKIGEQKGSDQSDEHRHPTRAPIPEPSLPNRQLGGESASAFSSSPNLSQPRQGPIVQYAEIGGRVNANPAGSRRAKVHDRIDRYNSLPQAARVVCRVSCWTN